MLTRAAALKPLQKVLQELVTVWRAVVAARNVVVQGLAAERCWAVLAEKGIKETVQQASTSHLFRQHVTAKPREVRQHAAL